MRTPVCGSNLKSFYKECYGVSSVNMCNIHSVTSKLLRYILRVGSNSKKFIDVGICYEVQQLIIS